MVFLAATKCQKPERERELKRERERERDEMRTARNSLIVVLPQGIPYPLAVSGNYNHS